jgi:hypothetical protein
LVSAISAFLSHLYIKTNILPRQARGKHRENSKKDEQKAACNVLSVEFFDDEMKIDDLNDLTANTGSEEMQGKLKKISGQQLSYRCEIRWARGLSTPSRRRRSG